MTHTTHTLSTIDQVNVSVDLYQHGTHDTAIIICPGFFQSKDTATFQRLSRALAQEYDVLAMDFRGHGRSGGLYTFSAREDADLEAVLAWARVRYARIGMLSFSLGAAITVNTLSRNAQGISSIILVSGSSSFEQIEFKFWTPEAMRPGMTGLEAGSGCRPGNLLLKKAKPVEHIAKLTPIPVFMIHGTRDVIVGVAHSHRLYAAAAEPKRLQIINGGSHAEALFRDDPQGFLALIQPWYRDTLQGTTHLLDK